MDPNKQARLNRHMPANAGTHQSLDVMDPEKLERLIGWARRSLSGDMSFIWTQYGVQDEILMKISRNSGYTLGALADKNAVQFTAADRGAGALTETLYYLLISSDEESQATTSLAVSVIAELYEAWSKEYYVDKNTEKTFTQYLRTNTRLD